jgi:hypothetical protein
MEVLHKNHPFYFFVAIIVVGSTVFSNMTIIIRNIGSFILNYSEIKMEIIKMLG